MPLHYTNPTGVVFQIILLTTALLFPGVLSAQETLELKDIISGSYQVPGHSPQQGEIPSLNEASAEGGRLHFDLQFKTGADVHCGTRYQFEWEFGKPLNELRVGEQIQIKYSSTQTGNNCRSGKAKMFVAASGGFSPEYKLKKIGRVAGLGVKNAKWLVADPGIATATATLNVLHAKSEYASLRLNFESTGPLGSDRLHFEVVYLFKVVE